MKRLSELNNVLKLPADVKSRYEEQYIKLYSWVQCNYEPTKRFQRNVVYLLNLLLYYLLIDGDVPYNWNNKNYRKYMTDSEISDRTMRSVLKSNFLEDFDVSFDFENSSSNVISPEYQNRKLLTASNDKICSQTIDDVKSSENNSTAVPSTLEDLYLRIPQYPRFTKDANSSVGVHVSLPEVPSKQCEISCTTDVYRMSEDELLSLYPNRLIRTRAAVMYEQREGITLDPELGLLIPVHGFTDAQVRDCIIRYPHIFQLNRVIDEKLTSFYNYIEIDGELLNVLQVWEYLPESRIFDLKNILDANVQIEFIKEYIIRRYLLERDILGIEHRYPIYGDLSPFITLFASAEWYAKEGFDAKNLAVDCVEARRRYLRSRNPKLHDIDHSVRNCVFDSFCCEPVCDEACINFVQFNYLLMRNDISYDNEVFHLNKDVLNRYIDVYNSSGVTRIVVSRNTNVDAKRLSYVAICNMWKGSAVRVTVYSIPFFKYVNMLQDSWNSKSEDFEYMDIWAKTSKCLIIYGLDYVYFKDFHSQLLLQLIQERELGGNKTFIVCPNLDNLQGTGPLFSMLVSKLNQNSVKMD